MMKMYKQPKTEVSAFETKLMQDVIVVSVNEGGQGGGVAGAPSRGGVAIP